MHKIKIKTILRNLKKDGFARIQNFLTIKEADKYISILSKNKSKAAKNKSFHKEAKLIQNLHLKNKKFYELIFNKQILKICDMFFKEGAYKKDVNIYQFDHMNARILKGKNRAQNLHIDSRICGVNPPTSLHFFIYLNETYDENGPTRFVKGSHLIKRYPTKKDNKKSESINCNKGDVIVLNSSIWHGSNKKSTSGERSIMTLVYTRWFLRQPFAIPFSIKKTNFKFTKKQKYLLGFYNYPAVNERQRQGRRGPLPKY